MKRWLDIGTQLPRAVAVDLVGEAFKKLEAAQAAHISDLRVLIDKGLEREAQLAKMVQLVVEDRYFRPTVTGKAPDNKVTSVMPLDALSDVAEFDDKADAEQMQTHAAREAELENELNALMDEQNQLGQHKVSV